jgi:hypothetical protein
VKATLFLHTMPAPKHGTLQVSSDDQWFFYPGKKTDSDGILLSN